MSISAAEPQASALDLSLKPSLKRQIQQRMTSALALSSTTLKVDLSNLGLSYLTEDDFSALQSDPRELSLNLADNRFRTLPEVLQHLPRLKALKLHNNRLYDAEKQLTDWVKQVDIDSIDIEEACVAPPPDWLRMVYEYSLSDAALLPLWLSLKAVPEIGTYGAFVQQLCAWDESSVMKSVTRERLRYVLQAMKCDKYYQYVVSIDLRGWKKQNTKIFAATDGVQIAACAQRKEGRFYSHYLLHRLAIEAELKALAVQQDERTYLAAIRPLWHFSLAEHFFSVQEAGFSFEARWAVVKGLSAVLELPLALLNTLKLLQADLLTLSAVVGRAKQFIAERMSVGQFSQFLMEQQGWECYLQTKPECMQLTEAYANNSVGGAAVDSHTELIGEGAGADEDDTLSLVKQAKTTELLNQMFFVLLWETKQRLYDSP